MKRFYVILAFAALIIAIMIGCCYPMFARVLAVILALLVCIAAASIALLIVTNEDEEE